MQKISLNNFLLKLTYCGILLNLTLTLGSCSKEEEIPPTPPPVPITLYKFGTVECIDKPENIDFEFTEYYGNDSYVKILLNRYFENQLDIWLEEEGAVWKDLKVYCPHSHNEDSARVDLNKGTCFQSWVGIKGTVEERDGKTGILLSLKFYKEPKATDDSIRFYATTDKNEVYNINFLINPL